MVRTQLTVAQFWVIARSGGCVCNLKGHHASSRTTFYELDATAGSRGVTDHGIKHLTRMPQLKELELGGRGSPITDGGLNVLRHLSELRGFHACWTPGFSDSGLAGLTYCDRLEDLNLLGTQAGDGVIQALAGKHHLRHFQSGRGVTDRGLAPEALSCSESLEYLWGRECPNLQGDASGGEFSEHVRVKYSE